MENIVLATGLELDSIALNSNIKRFLCESDEEFRKRILEEIKQDYKYPSAENFEKNLNRLQSFKSLLIQANERDQENEKELAGLETILKNKFKIISRMKTAIVILALACVASFILGKLL